MKNKTILITGATGGIGKATAIALAQQGAHVIIHGRDERKTQQVVEEIRNVSGNKRVDSIVADLFLLEEVHRLVNDFKKRFTHLDVLINNAGGIMSNEIALTKEGFEKTVALNLFAPFLLTNLLMDVLLKTEDGRIINVSSSSHRLNAKPDFNNMQSNARYSPLTAYGNAKLFLILNSQYLSAKLKMKGITNLSVNSMHPGAVSTNFGVDSNLGRLLNVIGRMARPLMRSVEKGAETLIYLASSDEVKGKSGDYYIDCKPALVNRKYNKPENEKKVWEYCKDATGSSFD